MERSSEYQDMATALAELRPAPRPEFTADLDERVAAGFPRRPRGLAALRVPTLARRLRRFSPRQMLFAGGATALAAIAVATVVASINLGADERINLGAVDPASGPAALDRGGATERAAKPRRHAAEPLVQFSDEVPSIPSTSDSAGGARLSWANAAGTALTPLSRSVGTGPVDNRAIERSAKIVLLAEPSDVAADSADVFAAVHDARGIVLRSRTTAGEDAGARFELLIPSARLGDALAAFSAIDEVRARQEATDDITAPTLATAELLRDSRARIDGLLTQLSAAETGAEMEAVETELRGERRHAARLRAQLSRLQRRADYSRVSLRIESGASATDSGGTWSIDDALGDAGRLLAVGAGVTLLALAVIAPLALIGLLAWLTHRIWLRTRRERALDA